MLDNVICEVVQYERNVFAGSRLMMMRSYEERVLEQSGLYFSHALATNQRAKRAEVEGGVCIRLASLLNLTLSSRDLDEYLSPTPKFRPHRAQQLCVVSREYSFPSVELVAPSTQTSRGYEVSITYSASLRCRKFRCCRPHSQSLARQRYHHSSPTLWSLFRQ